MTTIVCIAVYIVSAVLVAIYFKGSEGEKDVTILIPILCPVINTILVVISLLFCLLFGVIWLLEHFFLTKMLLRWLNNGKDVENFTD